MIEAEVLPRCRPKLATSHKSLLLASTAAASEPAFRAWMGTHGRTYEGAAEFEARLAVFVENTAAIAALNDDPEDGATYAMNAFGDLSADEFREHLEDAARVRRANALCDAGEWRAKAGGQ